MSTLRNRRHFLARGMLGMGAAIWTQRHAGAAETPPPAAEREVRWIVERISRGTDPLTGALVRQLTSATVISHAIYGEQLFCSADGNRIAFLRCYSTDFSDGPMELWVADIESKSVTLLGPAAFHLVAGNGKQDAIYYIRRGEGGGPPAIVRVKFATLEQTALFSFGKCPVPDSRGLLAVSPDGRYCMIRRRLRLRRYGIERIDLARGDWQLIHEKDDIFNAHLQFSATGRNLLVQQNRGGELDRARNIVRMVGTEGGALYTIDCEGKNERPLPVGSPHTQPITGHECWIGDSDRVLLTTADGKIYTATPGDPAAALVAESPGFMHISASPDGKFFVVDDKKTGRLHLGCLATLRLLPFCDTNTSSGSPQYTHTHPYITPGNRRVIFNSDRTGIPQVYAADIPEDFLAKLQSNDGA